MKRDSFFLSSGKKNIDKKIEWKTEKKIKKDEDEGEEDEDEDDEDEDEDDEDEDEVKDEDEAEEEETPDEKRVRLANEYLNKLQSVTKDKEEIAEHLEQARLKKTGKRQKTLAIEIEKLKLPITSPEKIKNLRGHKSSVTCLALAEDDTTAWTASKDSQIVKWDIESGKKNKNFRN